MTFRPANENHARLDTEFICTDCGYNVVMLTLIAHSGRCMSCQFIHEYVPAEKQKEMRELMGLTDS